MKKRLLAGIALLTLALSSNAVADTIDNYLLRPGHSAFVNAQTREPNSRHGISCGSSIADQYLMTSKKNNRLAVDVNPAQVLDKDGNWTTKTHYRFPNPVGTVKFFARSDEAKTISFVIINPTETTYEVTCNIDAG